MPLNGKDILPPEQHDVNSNLRLNIRRNLHKIKVGIVKSFNSSKRTAVVQCAFEKLLNDGSSLPYPLFLDCPVFTLQGGGIGAAFPIKSGDECIVLFSDQAIDDWFEEGGTQLPTSTRVHDLSDGLAIVGLNSLANPLALALSSTEGGISDAMAKVTIKNGLINISNATQSLLTILNLLTTYLTALNSALGSMTTASILAGTTQSTIAALATQITAITTDLAALLY